MYGTLTGWRAHATARGDNAPASALDVDATAALVRASDYILAHYVTRWRGAYDPLPDAVEICTYIAAGYELTTPGFFSKVYTPGERKVLTEVKGIKWSVLPGSSDMAAPVSSQIEGLMWPYGRINLPGIMAV